MQLEASGPCIFLIGRVMSLVNNRPKGRPSATTRLRLRSRLGQDLQQLEWMVVPFRCTCWVTTLGMDAQAQAQGTSEDDRLFWTDEGLRGWRRRVLVNY